MPPSLMRPVAPVVGSGRLNVAPENVCPGAKVTMPLAAKDNPVSVKGALPPAPKNKSSFAEGLVVLLFSGSARKPKASVFEVLVVLLKDDA